MIEVIFFFLVHCPYVHCVACIATIDTSYSIFTFYLSFSPLLHRVFADGFRPWCAFRFCGGASPHAFGFVRALGELRWLHLSTGPGWSPPICRVPLELRSVFHIFLCDVPHVCMAIILSVFLTPACPWLVIPIGCCSLDTCKTSD